MILHCPYLIVNCPVCGRPARIQSQYTGQEMACGHCGGHFAVFETDDGGLASARMHGTDSPERADRLLRRGHHPAESASSARRQALSHQLSALENDEECGKPLEASFNAACDADNQPTALLVEHRDEVFARIGTDMAQFGIRVIRAKTAAEALRLCGQYQPELLVANLHLPDQSGWLLAGKLRIVDQRIRVWLYETRSTGYGRKMARFLDVARVLDYGGELLGLSESIVKLMAADQQSRNAPPTAEETGKSSAA